MNGYQRDEKRCADTYMYEGMFISTRDDNGFSFQAAILISLLTFKHFYIFHRFDVTHQWNEIHFIHK